MDFFEVFRGYGELAMRVHVAGCSVADGVDRNAITYRRTWHLDKPEDQSDLAWIIIRVLKSRLVVCQSRTSFGSSHDSSYVKAGLLLSWGRLLLWLMDVEVSWVNIDVPSMCEERSWVAFSFGYAASYVQVAPCEESKSERLCLDALVPPPGLGSVATELPSDNASSTIGCGSNSVETDHLDHAEDNPQTEGFSGIGNPYFSKPCTLEIEQNQKSS